LRNLSAKSIAKPIHEFIFSEKVGVVHSVFDQSCNLLITDQLVGLVAPKLGNSPYNIILDCIDFENFEVGMSVKIHDRKIFIGADLVIDLASAAIWDPKILAKNFDWRVAIVNLEELMKSMPELVRSIVGKDEMEIYLAKKIENFSAELFSEKFSAENFSTSADNLIGLGSGLTPSGDDFLAGVVGIFHNFSQSNEIKNITKILDQTIISALKNSKTNMISKALLTAALQGWFAEKITNFLLVLGDKKSSDSQKKNAINQVLSIGHSSGADMLAGICLAFAKLRTCLYPN
jgi:hypothetical protein